jgi:excisionase family DNA binding protein
VEPLAVDIREAGRLLSLSPRTIRRHIQAGRIQAVRIGRRVLVPVEALTEMLKRNERSVSSDPAITGPPEVTLQAAPKINKVRSNER